MPLNCFLVAAEFQKTDAPREILLLRVTDPMALPRDDQAAQAKIEACQGRGALPSHNSSAFCSCCFFLDSGAFLKVLSLR